MALIQHISDGCRSLPYSHRDHSKPLSGVFGVNLVEGEREVYHLGMTRLCKKCGGELTGKQTSYCSEKCSRRHLKLLWQARRRDLVNATRSKWRKETGREKEPLEKKHARASVNRALKTGRIQRKPCEECGSPISQAHHSDYSKPLSVVWLCSTHHAEEHRTLPDVR